MICEKPETHEKVHSTSLVIRKVQIKTYKPNRMAKIVKTGTTICWLGSEVGLSCICAWECQMVKLLGKKNWLFLIKINIYLTYD